MTTRAFSLLLFPFLLLASDIAAGQETAADGKAPRIDRLVPEVIDICSLREGRALVVVGEFPEGTRILLDGSGMPAMKIAGGEMIVTVPALEGGVHQVTAVAPGERTSLPQALVIDTVPQITGVTGGEDLLTAHEAIVSGVNFLFESTLVVNGAALRPAKAEDPNAATPSPIGGKDYVRYRDCSTLIYVRHPVTREPETVTLRVVNPGGEQSGEYVVELP